MTAENIYTILIITFFMVWFVGTIVCQFTCEVSSFIHQHLDVLHLIPLWTFFAPRPGKSDYHLIFRDKRADESIGEWTELEISEGKNWLSFIWNPEKRKKKILSDIIQGLILTMNRYREAEDRSILLLTLPYILILHLVTQQESKLHEPLARQFVLAESPGYLEDREPTYILISKFHELN